MCNVRVRCRAGGRRLGGRRLRHSLQEWELFNLHVTTPGRDTISFWIKGTLCSCFVCFYGVNKLVSSSLLEYESFISIFLIENFIRNLYIILHYGLEFPTVFLLLMLLIRHNAKKIKIHINFQSQKVI